MKKIKSALELAKIATPTAPNSDHTLVYPKSDGKFYRQNSDGVETEVGSSAGFDTLVAGMSGLVHRWKFTETSGNFADSVGSLTLTPTNSPTYNTGTPPVGGAALFNNSQYATSSGLGSLPVAGAARAFVVVHRPTVAAQKGTLLSYGTWSSTRQMNTMYIDDGSNGATSFAVWADDMTVSSSSCDYLDQWQIVIASTDGTTAHMYINGTQFTTRIFAAPLNTGTSGNFSIGRDINSASLLRGYIDDISVFNRHLQMWECRKIMATLGY